MPVSICVGMFYHKLNKIDFMLFTLIEDFANTVQQGWMK